MREMLRLGLSSSALVGHSWAWLGSEKVFHDIRWQGFPHHICSTQARPFSCDKHHHLHRPLQPWLASSSIGQDSQGSASGRAARCLGEFVALGVVTETLKSVIAVSASPRVVTNARGWEGLEHGTRAAAAEEGADGLEEHHVLGEELLEVGFEEQVHQGVVERRGLGKDG